MEIFDILIYANTTDTNGTMKIPAIFFSRIFPQIVSAFRADQFSTFVEKLRKKRYSFTLDILSTGERNEIDFKLRPFFVHRSQKINSIDELKTFFYLKLIHFMK